MVVLSVGGMKLGHWPNTVGAGLTHSSFPLFFELQLPRAGAGGEAEEVHEQAVEARRLIEHGEVPAGFEGDGVHRLRYGQCLLDRKRGDGWVVQAMHDQAGYLRPGGQGGQIQALQAD